MGYYHYRNRPLLPRWSKRGIVVTMSLLTLGLATSNDLRQRANRIEVNFEKQAALAGMDPLWFHEKVAKEATCWSRYVGITHHTSCKQDDRFCPSIAIGTTTYYVCKPGILPGPAVRG